MNGPRCNLVLYLLSFAVKLVLKIYIFRLLIFFSVECISVSKSSEPKGGGPDPLEPPLYPLLIMDPYGPTPAYATIV